MSVADIGAGSGYFLIPAARIAGPEAPVFGVDASGQMLDILKKKSLAPNVKLVHTPDGYTFRIDSETIDFVIASSILHENDPVRFLREIRRIMKPGAWLLIIDWRKDSVRAGPPIDERLTPEEVKIFCHRSDLRTTKSLLLNPRYYAVVARRA